MDALFADGFRDLASVLEALPTIPNAIDGVVAVGEAVVDYCVTYPARYHLMFQRTVPGFAPSEESHAVALRCLGALTSRLSAAGVIDDARIALVRGIISGLASEQIANDPHGRQFADHVGAGIRFLLGGSPSGRKTSGRARS
jgi:hypothetical protein